ncbi:MAG: helix-turn-helix domain-containing protein [Deltaproteobacteria bacterium]|nr:helix-turn-helix domain-containing protein [Deltaproteobacteria bacterium]
MRLNSIKQIADQLHVSVATARRLIARGELPAVRIGRRLIRVGQEDIEALIRRWTLGRPSRRNLSS